MRFLKIVFYIVGLVFMINSIKSCNKRSEEEAATKAKEEAIKEAKFLAEQDIKNKKIELIFRGENQILFKLKDKSSASFANVFISTTDFVCGDVNSKNSFGGYSGYQRFISAYPSNMSALEENTNKRDFNKTWDKFCEYKTSTNYARSEHSH